MSLALFTVPSLCAWIYDTFLSWPQYSGLGFSMIVAGGLLLCAGAVAWMSERRER